ncbi:MAG: hypothetical protein IIX01_01850 [Clostridia bacterium]|nr:hypothetical protein [Clostridia bacterium]
MEKIRVTSAGSATPYMAYVYGKVTDKFSFLPAASDIDSDGERTTLIFQAEKKYCPYIRKCAEENIAEVIAIGYKYDYFKRILSLPLLNGEEKETLLTSLVAADFPEDKEFIRKKLCGCGEYCIDGVFHFRMIELKRRWEKIAEYIPPEFTSASLESFIDFLAEEGEGKVFLKDGEVYDEEYRLLTRSDLIGDRTPVREILLSGASGVYCFGAPDEKTTAFLKKYYKEKAVFC